MEQDGEENPVFQHIIVMHTPIILYPTILPTFQFLGLPLP